MKRIILLLVIAIMSTVAATAQLLGDGSMANPYRGFLSGDFTISGTKYFDGNIYVDNERLTISASTTLISLQLRASIFISDTGQLQAVGTAASPILFTSDLDRDGIYGEPTDTWGNITITSSNTSQISYCTFERGTKNHVKFGLLGGGLRLASSGVTVTNSTFRNCLAARGGAVAVIGGASPALSNCTFLNNVSQEQGGAIYVEGNSAPRISNALFNGNSSTSSTLKGGAIASISSSPKIINSTIAYSSSPVSDGTSVYLENSSGAIIVNSVIWGGSDHIGLNGTPSSVFISNAIEGVSYTGNITLNSSNTAPDGPNFVSPGTGNFRITFVSPMRDSGVDTYAGVTIPATDIVGTSRIFITDIGAYEMIYSRWNGSLGTSWTLSKNWEGNKPPGTTNIVIPGGLANYPTTSPGPSFTLNSGLEMIMEPRAKVTFSSLTNNGIIDLQSNSSGIASLMTNSFSGSSGSLRVNLFITGGSPAPGMYRWHYIAAPVTSPKSVFTAINPYNLLNYDESKVTTDIAQGWQWHDGYDGTTSFTTLDAKRGYDVFNNTDAKIVFSGLTSLTSSMGQISLPFSGSSGDTSLYGYYLVGNSLTCGINWDLATRSSTTYVRNAIYITKDDNVASYVNGVGTNGGTAHIPPLQGFFVKTRATGTYITIPDNAREHNSTVRFKSAVLIPLIRLELSYGAVKDETVIRFENQATLDFDNEYDAGKMFGPVNQMPQIYSVLNGENYSINSVPWPQSQTIIPLTLRIPVSGSYKIKRTELQGLGTSRATLTDNVTGSIIDLSTISEYSFTATSGTVAGRFIVTIYAGTADVKDQSAVSKSLKIYPSMGKVCVQPLGSEWNGIQGKVRIFDITGRVVLTGKEEWFNTGEIKEYYPVNASGMLIVEVIAEGKRYLEKIVLTK